jgi:large subunit ribosomal protein L9
MEIILKREILGLGEEGDIKNVKPGYARNYLIPKQFAVLKTDKNIAELEKVKDEIEKRKEERRFQSKSAMEKLEGLEIVITEKASPEGKLYGSVSALEITKLLNEQGHDIDKRQIEIGQTIKQTGEYSVRIILHKEFESKIKVIVKAEGEEAAKQEEAKEEQPTKTEKAAESTS